MCTYNIHVHDPVHWTWWREMTSLMWASIHIYPCPIPSPTPVLLPGKSHGWRSLEGCSPWGRWGSETTERLHFHFSLSCTGEGNGNPLQCSCLENPRDGGAWWPAIYGVAQSWTRLTWLSSSRSHWHCWPRPSSRTSSFCFILNSHTLSRFSHCVSISFTSFSLLHFFLEFWFVCLFVWNLIQRIEC